MVQNVTESFGYRLDQYVDRNGLTLQNVIFHPYLMLKLNENFIIFS